MTEVRSGLPVVGFADQHAFEQWIVSQPSDAPGLWVKFAKKGSGIAGLSKAQAVDTALCHGWIDGQLDKYDDAHWLVRFTPRKSRSKWSRLNRTRALELIDEGRVRAAGLAAIEAARQDGSWDLAYAPASTADVPSDLQAALDVHPEAAAFFATLTGANRYAILYRIGAAKRPETRSRRIADFVAMLARGETIHG
jgi:uncharacterized protein YdeI (YjbR/CyaY-like superfamily)